VLSVVDCAATVEKSRDGSTGERFPFRLRVVELGHDQDGDAVTTCVVEPTDAAPTQPKSRLSGVAQVALDALHEAISEQGERMPATSAMPAVKAATLEQWRSRFQLRYGSDERGGSAVRKAFLRAREALLKVSAIRIADPYVWVTHVQR
jgi:hypothetical protein